MWWGKDLRRAVGGVEVFDGRGLGCVQTEERGVDWV